MKPAQAFTLTVVARGALIGEWFNPLTNDRVPVGAINAGAQVMRPPDA